MNDPVADGEFESWSTLSCTLEPLLASSVSKFLKWDGANAAAISANATEFTVDLGAGLVWWQTIGGEPREFLGGRQFASGSGVGCGTECMLWGRCASLTARRLSHMTRLVLEVAPCR